MISTVCQDNDIVWTRVFFRFCMPEENLVVRAVVILFLVDCTVLVSPWWMLFLRYKIQFPTLIDGQDVLGGLPFYSNRWQSDNVEPSYECLHFHLSMASKFNMIGCRTCKLLCGEMGWFMNRFINEGSPSPSWLADLYLKIFHQNPAHAWSSSPTLKVLFNQV